MKLLLGAVTMIVALPVFAETLGEAVQHSLISNPEFIFNATKDLILTEEAHKARGSYNTMLDLNASYGRSRTDALEPSHKLNTAESKAARQAKPSEPNSSIFNQLTFNQQDESHLKTQGVANELAIGVVSQYLSILLQEKLVTYAQANLQMNRTVFFAVKQQKKSKINNQVALKRIASQVAQAESDLLRAQASLQKAKKNYAKVVGKWPSNLVLPTVPSNSDLPLSVGQAIEQGLDNAPSQAFANTTEAAYYKNLGVRSFTESKKNSELKRHSIMGLSKSIRVSWEEWTVTGLKLNTLRKRLTAANLARATKQENFKTNKSTALNFLNAQKKFYQAQIAYERGENAEIMARYRILDSIGRLVTFINTNSSQSENVASNDYGDSFKSVALPDMDLASYPYPDYKPRFRNDLVNAMEITALNSAKNHIDNTTSASSQAWFVSAGNFKSKANAVALVNRLKGLGFIVFMKTEPTGSSVLIGPYEYRGHAITGLERLKDIAHVQGVLLSSKKELHYG